MLSSVPIAFSFAPNVAFSCRRACGRLGTCFRLFPLNGSPLASVIGQLQRLVGGLLAVLLGIETQDSPNHCLIRSAVLLGDLLEERDAGLAQRDRDFDILLLEDEFVGRGEEVLNNVDITHRFIGVADSLLHRSSFLSSSNQRHRF